SCGRGSGSCFSIFSSMSEPTGLQHLLFKLARQIPSPSAERPTILVGAESEGHRASPGLKDPLALRAFCAVHSVVDVVDVDPEARASRHGLALVKTKPVLLEPLTEQHDE